MIAGIIQKPHPFEDGAFYCLPPDTDNSCVVWVVADCRDYGSADDVSGVAERSWCGSVRDVCRFVDGVWIWYRW